MAELTPNGLAAYYMTVAFLMFLCLVAIPHQVAQLLRYIARKSSPLLLDMPTDTKDKLNQDANYQRAQWMPIHSSVIVGLYKVFNTTIGIPSVGDMSVCQIALLLLYLTVSIVFLLLPFQDGGFTLTQLMNRAAYLALANSAFVFPLATRNSIFLTLIGVPFERIIRFHRWVGRMVFLMVALHGFTQIQNRYKTTNSAYDAVWGDQKQRTGFLSLLAVTIVTLTSHSLVRRYAFEVFYWGHFNFIFFFIFGALHNEWFLPFVGFGAALYAVDRLIRAMRSLEATKIVSAEAIQSGVSRIVFEREMSHYPGQYVFVNFPGLGGILSYFTWHPISLSSSTQFYDDIPYHSVHVKSSGAFTSNLYKSVLAGNSSDHGNLRMRVDGPYGMPSIDCCDHRVVMLCAGGVGVTPIVSILKDLVDHQVAGTNIATQAIYFVWIVPDVTAYGWFASELQDIAQKAQALADNKYLLDFKVFLTRSESSPSSIFFQGRPSFEGLMREIKKVHTSSDIAVAACGPQPMLREIRDASMTVSDRHGLVKVHCEEFEF